MRGIELYNQKNFKERREKLAAFLNIKLDTIGKSVLNKEHFAGHCENPIGGIQIPLGVAGPLQVQSSKFKVQSYYIPLATTEGALVASVNRGCKAAYLSGGVKVEVENVGVTRGPVFSVPNITEGRKFRNWLKRKQQELDKVARKTSDHLTLLNIRTRSVGRSVFVRFSFDTTDAMGMNMSTIATQQMADFIEKKTGYRLISLAGNFDIDKKPAWLNFLFGRGKMVWAEAQIKRQVIKEVLKTNAEAINEVVYHKSLLASAAAGSLGFNAHYANIIAALFSACGQDLAHVVEGSLGITTGEVEENGDLYFSVYLPCLLIGTIGGGTGLPTQREALSIIGVAGGNRGKNAQRLAAIVGAAVLAGELSLTASLAEGSLAKTHKRFRSSKGKAQTSKPSLKLKVVG